MDEITNLSQDAIIRYFNSLSKLGYKNYEDVSKLQALLTLEEMLSIFDGYITESDFRSIINAIYCLSGTTCMIDYPKYINDDTLFHTTDIAFTVRITEDSIIRGTQDNIIRVGA